MKFMILALAMIMVGNVARADPYANFKYGYSIDVPKAISVGLYEADAGDGIRSHSLDGQADFIAYGSFLADSVGHKTSFDSEVKNNIKSEIGDGWKIVYNKAVSKKWTAYSGTKGNRIFYARSIVGCSGQSLAVFRLEYPAGNKAAFDPVIKELNISFIDGGGCS